MSRTENYKDIQINERKFRIKKFSALTGGFMVIKLTGLLAPIFKKLDFSKLKDVKDPNQVDIGSFNISSIMAELGSISEEDFSFVQSKCLQVCYEQLPAGSTPVLDSSGNFAVIGLEEDTMAALALVVHTLVFNLQGFFSGSPLASVLGGLSTSSPQD